MRTDVVGPFKGSLKGSRRISLSRLPAAEINLSSFRGSGSNSETQMGQEMPNQTSTSISQRFFSYLSSNSRAARLLNVSYWIFMALSCISFFIFPWYLFLAFLIPALILLLIREVHKTSQACSDYQGPA